MNTFVNVAAYPTADMRAVVRPNFDTLYSSAWLDLTEGAGGRLRARHRRALLSAADARHVDRCLCLARLAHHRNASRQLPGHAARLAARSARPLIDEFKLPEGTQRIDAPTPYVWIIGRTKTDGPADYDAVHKIQAGYKITPLSEWGKTPKRRRGEDRSRAST